MVSITGRITALRWSTVYPDSMTMSSSSSSSSGSGWKGSAASFWGAPASAIVGRSRRGTFEGHAARGSRA